MKKFIIITLGMFMFSASCFAWHLTDEQKAFAQEYYDTNNQIYFKVVYDVAVVCPNGATKFSVDFDVCYGCETYDEFSTNVHTNYYYKKVYRDFLQIMMEESIGSYSEKESMFLPPPPPMPMDW